MTWGELRTVGSLERGGSAFGEGAIGSEGSPDTGQGTPANVDGLAGSVDRAGGGTPEGRTPDGGRPSAGALLSFERVSPTHPSMKAHAVRKALGWSLTRYYMELHRAASSLEGMLAEPETARRVMRERDRRRAIREGVRRAG